MLIQIYFSSDEFQSFMSKLPTQSALNSSAIQQLWRTDSALQQRYRQLESHVNLLLSKTRRTANKLFSLSKRCRTPPKIVSLKERYNIFIGTHQTRESTFLCIIMQAMQMNLQSFSLLGILNVCALNSVEVLDSMDLS